MSAHINISLLDTSNIEIDIFFTLFTGEGGREGGREGRLPIFTCGAEGGLGSFLLRYLLIVSDTNDCHL